MITIKMLTLIKFSLCVSSCTFHGWNAFFQIHNTVGSIYKSSNWGIENLNNMPNSSQLLNIELDFKLVCA